MDSCYGDAKFIVLRVVAMEMSSFELIRLVSLKWCSQYEDIRFVVIAMGT